MQPETAEQRDDDVSEGRGGQDVGKICPTKRREIAGEEADEHHDACGDPRMKYGGDEGEWVIEGDGGHLTHAACEATVAERSADGDQCKDDILAQL